MNLFATQLRIDMAGLLHHSSEIFALVATAITMYLLLRFGVEPEAGAKILPAFLLGAMVITLLYGTHATFTQDAFYDRISFWHSSKLSMEWIIFSRFLAHLICSALPLVACFSAIIWLEGEVATEGWRIALIMLQVAIFVVSCGMVASSFSVIFRQSASFVHLLTLPFLFSAVIFASDAMMSAQSSAGDWLMLICAIFTPISCFICAKLL